MEEPTQQAETQEQFFQYLVRTMQHEFRRYTLYTSMLKMTGILLLLIEVALVTASILASPSIAKSGLAFAAGIFGIFGVPFALGLLMLQFCQKSDEAWEIYQKFVCTKLLACDTREQIKTCMKKIREDHWSFGDNTTTSEFKNKIEPSEKQKAELKKEIFEALPDEKCSKRTKSVLDHTPLIPELASIVIQYEGNTDQRDIISLDLGPLPSTPSYPFVPFAGVPAMIWI